MGIHRFQLDSINAQLVGELSEPGLTASQLASLPEIDVTLTNDALLPDLAAAMAQFGYSFVASAPTTPRRTANLLIDMNDPGAVPPVSGAGSTRSYYDNAKRGVMVSIDGSPFFRSLIAPRNGTDEFDDFLTASGSTIGETLWISATNGSGSAVVQSTSGLNGSHQGIIQMQTGTTAAGRGAIRHGSSPVYSNVAAAGGNSQIEFQTTLGDALPSIAEDYNTMLGWTDVTTGTGFGSNAALLTIDRSISASNWVAKTIVGATVTNTDTGIAVSPAGTWDTIAIDISSTGARFFVNGALAATHALATLPGATVPWNPFAKIQKIAGTTTRRLLLDYAVWGYRLNPAR